MATCRHKRRHLLGVTHVARSVRQLLQCRHNGGLVASTFEHGHVVDVALIAGTEYRLKLKGLEESYLD